MIKQAGRRSRAARTFSSAVIFLPLIGCQRTAAPAAPAPRVECAEPAGATRLLGAEPVVPFAWLSAPAIVEAGVACCTAFSQANDYYALDPWGKGSGPFRVEGYEDYDVTRCRELVLDGAPTNAVLFTSRPLPEQARPLRSRRSKPATRRAPPRRPSSPSSRSGPCSSSGAWARPARVMAWWAATSW